MRRTWLLALLALGALLALLLAPAALAQQDQPPAAPQNLTIFTAYPAQEIAIGETVSFDLKLRGGTALQTVRLSVQDLPKDWTATFRGGGKVIQAAYVDPLAKDDTTVQLSVAPTKDIAANTYHFAVVSTGTSLQPQLPIALIVTPSLSTS